MSHDHLRNGALPNKGIKSPSKLLSLKYQSQSSLGEQDMKSSSPKRVHFINTITIISKEDKTREIGIIEPNTKDNDHDTIVEVVEKVGKKFSGSEIVIEEAKSRDIERGNLGDRARRNTKEVEEVGGWMEYEEPLDLVETCDESVYKSLIEKMSSCSSSFDFRIETGDPSNLKIPCMIRRKFLANAYIDLDSRMNITKLISVREQGLITSTDGIKDAIFRTPYKGSEMVDLTNEGHDLLSSRVILSKDDYRRGCERASDLESGLVCA
ncbi:hypothetical protein Tco_0267467 [Tanacetum coccineum]